MNNGQNELNEIVVDPDDSVAIRFPYQSFDCWLEIDVHFITSTT